MKIDRKSERNKLLMLGKTELFLLRFTPDNRKRNRLALEYLFLKKFLKHTKLQKFQKIFLSNSNTNRFVVPELGINCTSASVKEDFIYFPKCEQYHEEVLMQKTFYECRTQKNEFYLTNYST